MVGFVRAKLRARFAKMQSLTSVAKGLTSIQQRGNARGHCALRAKICLVYENTDAMRAYLFQGDDIGLFAVSLDKSGRNIPRSSCPEGWRLKLSSPSPSPNQYR